MNTSSFKIIRKSSKTSFITEAIREQKLISGTLEAAVDEARLIANEETSILDVVYVTEFGTFVMKTVRPSRKAMAEFKAWQDWRTGRAATN